MSLCSVSPSICFLLFYYLVVVSVITSCATVSQCLCSSGLNLMNSGLKAQGSNADNFVVISSLFVILSIITNLLLSLLYKSKVGFSTFQGSSPHSPLSKGPLLYLRSCPLQGYSVTIEFYHWNIVTAKIEV